MHKTRKPVRKCHGCKLNLDDHCAVFPYPHKRWSSGKCKGFKNEEFYQKYLDDQTKHPPDPRHEQRREHARQTKTEPHHSGTLSHRSPLVDRRRSR